MIMSSKCFGKHHLLIISVIPCTLTQMITSYLIKFVVVLVCRMLQEKLEEPISEPPSPRQFTEAEDTAGGIATHITSLREEIRRLRLQLAKSEADCKQFLIDPYSKKCCQRKIVDYQILGVGYMLEKNCWVSKNDEKKNFTQSEISLTSISL